jgi:hypothetical protein
LFGAKEKTQKQSQLKNQNYEHWNTKYW